MLTLPRGDDGLSGAIVDPFTANNTNNTINRIQLTDGVPATFYFHVLTDNTAREHDPANRLRARGKQAGVDVPLDVFPRGEVDGVDIDPQSSPVGAELAFNGMPDIYTFRYDGFVPNDFIKLQLNGGSAGASFGGVLFDDAQFSLSDADGDKILDGYDRCPTKASTSHDGCPPKKKHKPKRR
ncbi:MAG: hypothetical protein WD826_02625 [Actinomycetota bacterium]